MKKQSDLTFYENTGIYAPIRKMDPVELIREMTIKPLNKSKL